MTGVELLHWMGDDSTVVDAARVSRDTAHHQFSPERNARLIQYLADNGHRSPFYHCQAQFRITAPIFVARQLMRHHVGLAVNEVSRRYTDTAPTVYHPKEWYDKPIDGRKQGSGERLPDDDQAYWSHAYQYVINQMIGLYQEMIDDGVAPEQARMVLPVSTLTAWVWTGSLYAFYNVCRERCSPNTQEETRKIAQTIAAMLSEIFPLSWKALTKREAE